MRVISGLYRGRNLKSPPSREVRPTSDRLRETLFNIIAPRIVGARFLDLCSGSGAIGIEALSRGAAFVTFIDRSRKACGLIEANLDLCVVPENQIEVVLSDAADYVHRASAPEKHAAPWDIVFYDPPYADDYQSVLELFAFRAAPLLAANGLLIAEHHHKTALPDALGALRRLRMRKQGDSVLSFYELETSAQSTEVD